MRYGGILMHISSLPSPYGIGTLGKAAYNFVDFLVQAGQKYWQVLPVCPTSYGDSPYQSFSPFAGNPYFIDLDILCKKGLLTGKEIRHVEWGTSARSVDYGILYEKRYPLLQKAVKRFTGENSREYQAFCAEQGFWLEEYALFMALKDHHGGASWRKWEERLRFRDKSLLDSMKQRFADKIKFWKIIQYWFYEQWMDLKGYANNRGIEIIGDMPIYIADDSADVWVYPELFSLDENLDLIEVAGCPPDDFTEDGQLWGNPLFRWDVMQKDGYAWWMRRMRQASVLFDITRIDHFRGFDTYYAIPAGSKNARKGEWREGPGIDFFHVLKQTLGNMRIIAEDLGHITPSVRKLLQDTEFPGMKVLQFAFDRHEDSDYLPHNYPQNCVAYTGTHDNETFVGWLRSAPRSNTGYAKQYMRLSQREGYHWGVMKCLWASMADSVIIPMQDVLGLDNTARMNTPSTLGGNWKWRALPSQINKDLAKKVKRQMSSYKRMPKKRREDSNHIQTNMDEMERVFNSVLRFDAQKTAKEATAYELHGALAKSILNSIAQAWITSKQKHNDVRHAFYFSAEFLVGRAIYNNLLCLGITEQVEKMLKKHGASLKRLEEIEDAALGNGGLGRLAACFLDSAATLNLPLDGYGIRYKYGLFKQAFEDGFQKEWVDDWTKYGDPWSVRKEDASVLVLFADQTVRAIPYDMPIIGYDTKHVSTLRLWQAEALEPFDFTLFNEQEYEASLTEKNRAENISRVLYPNDSTVEGKKLRLKQQYFFCSASLQDILSRYKKKYGNDFSHFAAMNAIQLNDTHPVISIPELIRLLVDVEGIDFETAFSIARDTFSYTNHTIMAEALEKWNAKLMEEVIPRIAEIISLLDQQLLSDFKTLKVPSNTIQKMRIIQGKEIHMACLALYATHTVNGVAHLHTEILKKHVLRDWFVLYPNRFQNKTNGITQRRWLALSNPELATLLTRLLHTNSWLTDLMQLKKLEIYADDEAVLHEFMAIKQKKKAELADYIRRQEGIAVDEHTIYDVQIKRLHEYKRQLLNILAILELYFELKEGTLTDFTPTTFIFGAKAAPGYKRAKGIIKLIHAVAALIEQDSNISPLLKVIFISNYNVSYAEKIIAAADVSEQISTAGTEASGTGNMKLMLNGAVTFGTYDGANIEIVEEAGEENNYIFGATIEEIDQIANTYNPEEIYNKNPHVKRVLDALIDGSLDDDGTGVFQELYNSLLKGAEWHDPDQYYLLLDFDRYVEAKRKINRDYKESTVFAKKCWLNLCHAGKFSSDRTIGEYATDIWRIESVTI